MSAASYFFMVDKNTSHDNLDETVLQFFNNGGNCPTMTDETLVPYFDFETTLHYGDHDAPAEFLEECPFCGIYPKKVPFELSREIRNQTYKAYSDRFGSDRFLYKIYPYQCEYCGWWFVRHIIGDQDNKAHAFEYSSSALLKSTPASSLEVPVQPLADYLAKNEEKIYSIHPSKMEELVGAVMAECYSCDVRYVGGSGDRGIDLLLLLGDDIIPIQVKRRMTPSRTESVSVVRDMLGVMFRDQRRKGMIVTTADHFSTAAQRDADEVLSKKIVDRLDLVDVHNFLSMMRHYCGTKPLSYLAAIPSILGGSMPGIEPKNISKEIPQYEYPDSIGITYPKFWHHKKHPPHSSGTTYLIRKKRRPR